MPIGLTTTRSAGMTGMTNKLHRGRPLFPGYLALLPGPDEDEVGDRPVRLGGIGLNPEDDIFDPEFLRG